MCRLDAVVGGITTTNGGGTHERKHALFVGSGGQSEFLQELGDRGDCDSAQTWSVRCCSFLRRATTSCSSVSTLLLLRGQNQSMSLAWVTRHPLCTETQAQTHVLAF